MKLITKFALVAVISALAVSSARADIITTLFAANNGGSLGGAVYFDLRVANSPIEIKALEINTAELVPFSNLQVCYCLD